MEIRRQRWRRGKGRKSQEEKGENRKLKNNVGEKGGGVREEGGNKKKRIKERKGTNVRMGRALWGNRVVLG